MNKTGEAMYLYLGNDITIKASEVIGIFDLEKISVQKSVNDFLSHCQRTNKIYYVTLDMPKSIVVCENCVYVTGTGVITLKKRIGEIS